MPQKIRDHRLIGWLGLLAFLFVAGGFGWALATLGNSGASFVILHFSDQGGVTASGDLGNIIFMGIFGLLVVGMNFLIALEFDIRDRFWGKFTIGMTLLFAVLLFLAFTAIINVNV